MGAVREAEMTRLVSKLLVAVVAFSCCLGVAYAADSAAAAPAADKYGYSQDDVAVNQGIVAYWYAHGYRAAFGNFPKDFAEMTAKGLPYRDFKSPATGDKINPDDGSLDFNGDFTYGVGGDDVWVKVKTSAGEVTIPSTVTENSDISASFGPCCCQKLCGTCFDPTLCCMQWKCFCSDAQAGCAIVAWMMWKSFEAHRQLFGASPASADAFMASGLCPVGSDFNKYNATMTIDWTYREPTTDRMMMHGGKDGVCCRHLVKAYVQCCKNHCGCCCEAPTCPTGKCQSCGGCNKGNSCNKCNTCNKCNSCNKCNKCNSCNKCNKCGCKSKCNSCNKCNTCSSCGK
jgi:hypothetical protein